MPTTSPPIDCAAPQTGSGIAPPMEPAALSVRGAVRELRIPRGTLHLGQRVKFSSPARVEEGITCRARLSNSSVRSNGRTLVVGLSVAVGGRPHAHDGEGQLPGARATGSAGGRPHRRGCPSDHPIGSRRLHRGLEGLQSHPHGPRVRRRLALRPQGGMFLPFGEVLICRPIPLATLAARALEVAASAVSTDVAPRMSPAALCGASPSAGVDLANEASMPLPGRALDEATAQLGRAPG